MRVGASEGGYVGLSDFWGMVQSLANTVKYLFMSPFIPTEQIQSKELFPGFHAKMIHTDGLTIIYFDIKAGSVLPEHHHVHEQVTNVLEGTLELTVGGETHACTPGTVVAIPPNVAHSGRAISDCKVIDVFRPVREDYKMR